VRYADLSQNRSSDYVFAWDKILSFEGNTAPTCSTRSRASAPSSARPGSIPKTPPPRTVPVADAATAPATPQETALARKLVGFATRPSSSPRQQLRPHFLCTYLYELAGEFSAFYAADKVIVDDPSVRARRLLLCASHPARP
jgi:arginyl-tRNA synthetase